MKGEANVIVSALEENGTAGVGRVRRGETVLFLGESHTLSFAERIVSRDGAPPLVCQPLFVPNAVSLSNVTNANGQLNAFVRATLRSSRLIAEVTGGDDDDVTAAADLEWRRVIRKRFASPPLVVVCLGSYDIFLAIDQFPGEDFVLPSAVLLHPLAPQFGPVNLPGALSIDHATTFFVSMVKPFQHALTRLRKLGFERMAFLSITPPTLDNAAVARSVEGLGGSQAASGRLRAAFRYKAALFLNGLAAQICEAENVAFLDSWPLLTRDGVVRPDVLADAAHLNEAAIESILLRLIVPAAGVPTTWS